MVEDAAAGFQDSPEDAFTYVRKLSAPNVPDANIRAFVENAAPMLRIDQQWSNARLTPLRDSISDLTGVTSPDEVGPRVPAHVVGVEVVPS